MAKKMNGATNDYLTNVLICNLPIDSIMFPDYQRNADKSRILRMTATFNLDRMRPIDVVYRNNQYWCFDGQHRVLTYRALGFPTIPAIVHYGLSYEEEAKLFASQAENVSKVNNRACWNANRLAGDSEVLQICKICGAYGYEVAAKKTNALVNIQCIASLQKIYREQGEAGLTWVMRTIYDNWYALPSAVSCDIVDGLAAIYKVHGSVIDSKKLSNVLKKVTPEIVIRDAGKYRFGSYSRRDKRGIPAAKVILSLYNKGYHIDSPKRLADPFTV